MSVNEHEIIEAQLVPYVQPAPMNLFGAAEPESVIERASAVAGVLSKVLDDKKLFSTIGGRKHVLVEGWTLLGSMLGVFPICVWTRQMENGWEARVEARTRGGELVGAAEAQCLRTESNWRSRDDFALRSMAQTRATAKALRQPLGFVVTLAGYEATPADELSPSNPGRAEGERISTAQNKKIAVLLKELEEKQPTQEGQKSYVDQLREDLGVTSRKDLSKEQASRAIEMLEAWKDSAGIPFG